MKKLYPVLAICLALALTACSKGKPSDVSSDTGEGSSAVSSDESYAGTSDVPITSSDENKGQSFTKDFDGVVLTVTTDKSTYRAGEPINVTATLENKSNKDINLFYFHIPDKDSELEVNIDRLIKEPFSASYSRPDAEFILPVKQGEKFVRNYKYHAYTGFLQDISESGKVTYSPDPDKIAEAGVYNGSCTIRVCDEPNYPQGDITKYSLDFSVTLI